MLGVSLPQNAIVARRDFVDDDFISSIAPELLKCIAHRGFFENLDGLLSPKDNWTPSTGCGKPTGQHFVKRDAEGVKVAPRIDRVVYRQGARARASSAR